MLPDILGPGLAAVFVGTSIATASVRLGHYYAGPGNKFWQLLWEAGLTGERPLAPDEDKRLPEFGLGLTDVVKGVAASSDGLLRSTDYDIPAFVRKIAAARPTIVAFNGKEAARRTARTLHRIRDVELGRASWIVDGAEVFVLPSSSGSSSDPRHVAPRATKAEWWCELGDLLRASRQLPQ